MTATLHRSEVGTVGYAPGTLLLNTTDNLATITTAGYINKVAGNSAVAVYPTDFVFATYNGGNGVFVLTVGAGGAYTMVNISTGGTITGGTSLGGSPIYAGVNGTNLTFKGLSAGSGITLTPTGTTIAISASGGGGGFAYVQALWVAQANGSDTNAGTSIDSPLLTVQAAVTLAGTTPTIIYVVDANNGNNETIATTGAGQQIYIYAPGTEFQNSITQSANDELILYCALVDAFITNSASPTIIDGGNINVTSTSTGQINCTCYTYAGAHTGGAQLVLFTQVMSFLSLDASSTANVNALICSSITNAGTLGIWTNTAPGVCLASNTGTIQGVMGGVTFGESGVCASTASDAAYNLPVVDGTSGQGLQTDGAGNVTWQNGAGGFAYDSAYWVSQANGSDSNSGTSIDTPLQTVQAAINLAVSISSSWPIIYVVDGYAGNVENIDTTGIPQLYIFAPGTSFNGNLNISSELSLTAAYVNNVTINSAAILYCSNLLMSGTLINNGIINGSINNGNTILTNYASGFGIAGETDVAPAYILPVVDGTANQTQQTDGAGNVTWVTGTVGVTDGSTAASGIVGEVISSQVLFADSISLSTTTPADITSISLTAGDWDVWANGFVAFSGAAGGGSVAIWISQTSETIPDFSLIEANTSNASDVNFGSAVAAIPVSVSAPTTYYLSTEATFSLGTATACGIIYARRRR